VTDGQTDGQTDGRTDGQNYDSQDRASIAASRGKNQNRGDKTVNRNGGNSDNGIHRQEDKTTTAGTCTSNGRQTNATSSIDAVPKRWQKGPKKSWSDMLTEGLQNIKMTWSDYGEIADDRHGKTVPPNVFPEHVERLRSKD